MDNKETRQRVIDIEADYIKGIVSQLACMTVDNENRATLKKRLSKEVKRYILILDEEEREEA